MRNAQSAANGNRRGRIGSDQPSLRVGVVGCGHILHEHIRGWDAVPDAGIHGLFDLDAALATRRATEIPGAVVFDSLDALIDACDIVDVCAPPGAHRDIAVRAMEGGRAVLIEKPVTLTLAHWEEVHACATRTGARLGAIYQHKHGPHVVAARDWVSRGRVGEVVRVSCDFFVDPSLDPMLATEGHWAHRLAGGRWFEVLPHLLYLVHLFTGRIEVDHVAVSNSPDAPPGAPADDVVATLRGERCLATVHLSARSHLDRRRIVVTGSQGTVDIGIIRGVSTCTDLRRVREIRGVGLVGLPFIEAANTLAQMVPDRLRHLDFRRGPTQHGRLMRAFADYVRGEGPSPTPLAEIDSVLRCCVGIGEAVDAALVQRGGAPLSMSAGAR